MKSFTVFFRHILLLSVLFFGFQSLVFSQTTYRDTTPAGVFLTIHDRPHIAPLDTLAALCAGADLNMPVPVTDYCGSDSVGSGWKLGGVAVTMPHRVSFSDNGKALVYWAENACGDSTTVGVVLTVHDSPLLEALDLSTRPGVLCAGTVLKEGVNIDAPVIHANGSPIIKKGWLLGGVPVMENGSGYVVTYADRLKEIRYYALNACTSDTVQGDPASQVTSAGGISVTSSSCGEVVLASTGEASVSSGGISYEWYEGSTKVGASAANGGTLTGVSAGSHTYKRKAIASGNTSSYLEVSQTVAVASCVLTDSDGNTYPTVVIGSQTWMAKNLNDSKKGGVCYDNNATNCATYGRLYNWDEAVVACPAGWHLPSDAEWKTLEMALGMTQADADKEGFRNSGDVGIKLKEGGSSGMNLLLGGLQHTDGSYGLLGTYGYYWTSTGNGSSNAWYRVVSSSEAGVYRNPYNKAYRFSVRCLKDK